MTEQIQLDELKRSAMNPSQWIKATSDYSVRQVGFYQSTSSDKVKYKTVCREYRRWVVNGRIIEPGDPAEPKSQPIFMDRYSNRILGAT